MIEEGEEIWKEEPFIIAPEWFVIPLSNAIFESYAKLLLSREIWDAQRASVACAHCTTTMINASPLHKECTRSKSECPARFCSTLCRQRAGVVHPLMCTGANPATIPFFRWAREMSWMAPNALAHCLARVILAYEKREDGEEYKQANNFVRSLAEMSLEQRTKDIGCA